MRCIYISRVKPPKEESIIWLSLHDCWFSWSID